VEAGFPDDRAPLMKRWAIRPVAIASPEGLPAGRSKN
jgi:hypothetical protein